MKSIEIISVNISEKKGEIKLPAEKTVLTKEGITGDAHAGKWHRQVSLLGVESIDKFSAITGRNYNYGEFAENITTKGLQLNSCKPGDIFKNSGVELMVTQIGKKCHGDGCAIFRESGACVMPKEGIFAKVITPGTLRAGDKLEYIQKVIKTGVITLSTRASEGIYEDLSGPEIISALDLFSKEKGFAISTEYRLIPDSKELLGISIKEMINSGVEIIITTGGTGIGPQDITPEVVISFIDKEIPGIMEYIRQKYGANKPNALLSRSVAGLAGDSLIFALPGSVKAAREYMSEICPLLEHMIYMKMGLDIH